MNTSMKNSLLVYCIIIFILFLFTNCFRQNRSFTLESSIFPDSIQSFFTVDFAEAEVREIGTNALLDDIKDDKSEKFNTYYQYHIYSFIDSLSFETAKKSLENYPSNSYDTVSKTVFPIGSEWELLNRFDSAYIKHNYQNLTLNQLVPFFCDMFSMEDDWYSSDTSGCLKDYIVINVLKSGSKKLIDFESFGKTNDWELLPVQLKHGYLLGVSINSKDKEIMYWVTTW